MLRELKLENIFPQFGQAILTSMQAVTQVSNKVNTYQSHIDSVSKTLKRVHIDAANTIDYLSVVIFPSRLRIKQSIPKM